MSTKEFIQSIPEFIKTSSFATLSTTNHSAFSSILNQAIKDKRTQNLIFDYSLDIIRPSDLLHLKYHFVNKAEIFCLRNPKKDF